MSKKGKHEPHQEKPKQGSSGKALTVIIILCFLGILPVLVWVSLPESSPYESVTSGSVLVQVAADAAGLEICSQQGVPVNAPGATSAVLYTLSPTCTPSSTVVQVLVVGFSSTDALNAALYQALQTYSSSQASNLQVFIDGYNVILVQGSPGNTAAVQVGNSLAAQGATPVPL
jgi:hypothetical protein